MWKRDAIIYRLERYLPHTLTTEFVQDWVGPLAQMAVSAIDTSLHLARFRICELTKALDEVL